MITPAHKNRTPEDIISEHIYHDAPGFCFRAISWLDLAKRTSHFAPFHYACVDARLALEHLIFEQLVITAGESLTQEAYKRCLVEPRKLSKLLRQIVPDYEKLQAFTEIVGSLSPGLPPINQWNIKELQKSWGSLSSYLHWSGAHPETTENADWQSLAINEVTNIIEPLWQKMSSAQSGSVRLETMPPQVLDIWEEFRVGNIDRDSVRIRLELIRGIVRGAHSITP